MVPHKRWLLATRRCDGLLNEFNGAVQSIIQQLKILTFQNQKLRAARDLLLPRLMSGEIAV
jgi:type I restriction enzyme, S subunit